MPLRKIEDNFPTIKHRRVTVIRVRGDEFDFASTVAGKRKLLISELKRGDRFMAVWTGQRHSDVFEVTAVVIARWSREL
jgi:hypothetical protein